MSAASAHDCLVPACDKLHNLRCINSELRAGHDTFGMLNAGAAEQIWNFSALTAVFEAAAGSVVATLDKGIVEMGSATLVGLRLLGAELLRLMRCHVGKYAADDAAVSNQSDALDLAAALVKLSRLVPVKAVPVCSMGFVAGSVSQRVARLLAWDEASKARRVRVRTWFVIPFAVAAATSASVAPVARTFAPASRNAVAIPSPIPDVPPITTAVLPA